MNNARKKKSIKHYKIGNVVYMQDFLTWRTQNYGGYSKDMRALRAFFIFVILASLIGFYLVCIFCAFEVHSFRVDNRPPDYNQTVLIKGGSK